MTDQRIERRLTVLLLMPQEAALIRRALEWMPKQNGGGEPQLRDNVISMLASSTFTARELGELEAIAIGDER